MLWSRRGVDDHVILCRHVAVKTPRAGTAGPVMMVRRHVEFLGQVALGAQRIAFGAQLGAVRVVAIRAGDPAYMRLCRNEPYS
jgi:hypothetical protein